MGVAVSPDGTKVYVVNYDYGTVSVIDSATNTVTATINVGGGANAFGRFIGPKLTFPLTNLSSNITMGNVPLSVQFTDLSKYATELNWNFGDGSNSTEQNPTHTYYAAGNYTVNLTATNGNGTDSKLLNITVLGKSLKVFPVANFSTNVTSGYAPLLIKFNDSSKNVTEWNWNFGDGTNSTQQNPTYTYTVAGNYTVNLTGTLEMELIQHSRIQHILTLRQETILLT